jgi:hypothetical protein
MFALELRSFGFIVPKTWVTLADVRYRATAAKVTHVVGTITPKDLSSIVNIS